MRSITGIGGVYRKSERERERDRDRDRDRDCGRNRDWDRARVRDREARPPRGLAFRGGGVEVIVAVDVIGPVTVAVHVHVNDTVIAIGPVDATSATAASTGR